LNIYIHTLYKSWTPALVVQELIQQKTPTQQYMMAKQSHCKLYN